MAEVIVYYLADCLAASQAFAVIKFMTERRNIKFSFYTAGSAGAFLLPASVQVGAVISMPSSQL